jgi:hypothetical protein
MGKHLIFTAKQYPTPKDANRVAGGQPECSLCYITPIRFTGGAKDGLTTSALPYTPTPHIASIAILAWRAR